MDSTHYQPISKESFYSGLNGTTKIELNILIAVFPSSLFLCYSFQLLFPILVSQKKLWFSFALEFVLIVLPVILAFTVLCDHKWTLLLAQLITSVLLLCTLFNGRKSAKNTKAEISTAWQSVSVTYKRQFVTDFRVFVNIATACSILAVDFRIYPRRFAKTETYGTGLMDVGVGLFMMGNALVAPEARGTRQPKQESSTVSSCLYNILGSIISCTPLLVLGLLRLCSVKSIDYHEHVSEYGVHWNFFFTLAVVRILVTAVFTFIPVQWSAAMGISLAVCYHYLLNMHGLEDYILHGSDGQGSRNGILEANREGIYSSIGYCAIYLIGVSLGRFLFQIRTTVGDWLHCLLKLCLLSMTLWVISALVDGIDEPVSRRLANLPYVLWMITFGISILVASLMLELCMVVITFKLNPILTSGELRPNQSNSSSGFKKKGLQPADTTVADKHSYVSPPRSLIMDAVAKNQLFFFLLANLLTGAVNLSMDTISAPPFVSLVTVVVYMFVLCSAAVVLYVYNVSTKIW